MITFAPLAQAESAPAVKICGLRSMAPAAAAAGAGAALLGFIFAASSRRRVEPAQVAGLLAALRRRGYTAPAVGVFVNETPQEMNRIADECDLAVLQLSGDEPPAIFSALARPAIVTIRLRGDARERDWIELARREPEHVLLHVDAHLPGSYGGTGVAADWRAAAELARELPLLLAGGLSAANVVEAIRTVEPLGVDVSSGVETDGVKDPDKIRAFLQSARSAAVGR